MTTLRGQRFLLGLLSVAGIVALHTLVSSAHRLVDLSFLPSPVQRSLQPDVLPPTQRLLEAFVQLVSPPATDISGDHAPGDHGHGDHAGGPPAETPTLQGSLLLSTYRVLFGLLVGAPLGILSGLAMAWSRKIDDYLHPTYVLLRSIPPLALITYVMLWLGHGEARLLIPIVYAVSATLVIPAYHGVRDIPDIYLKAARSLGASRKLLLSKVMLPAASPSILSGLRYSLVIAWMTTVGAEMLIGEDGIGHLLAGGGIWSSRYTIRVDPAIVMVGIASLALTGYGMDSAARIAIRRLTLWMRQQQP